MRQKHAKPPVARKQKPKLLARLEGKVFLDDRDVALKHAMRSNSLVMGRSDPAFIHSNPFRPAKQGVHLGLGISNKLSRTHARIDYHPATQSFTIVCLGKNGLSLTSAEKGAEENRVAHHTDPLPLTASTVIKIADCVLVFTLPQETPPRAPPPLPAPQTKKRKRREWIKSEHLALRAQMMRLGYGRWQEIINATNGRLSERQPAELIPVARKFVARCYIHARPGVEQKALLEILRQQPVQMFDHDEAAILADVENIVQEAKEEAEPGEKRKYVRWARKLRLLSRLKDVHDHPSLERLRVGQLRVFTPPPALYWTSEDDANLIVGSYKHGYGATEAIRTDPDLGFLGRYSKPLSAKKVTTPSKTDKPVESTNASEEDDDDEEDPDEDEDDRHAMSLNDDMDDDNAHDAVHNPKKRLKLGDRAIKKEDSRMSDEPTPMDDSDMSPSDAKLEPKLELSAEKDAKDDDATMAEKPKKKRLVPKRGPRIGNEDGFNNPADAKAAAEQMADDHGLVPFPNSEALMRRLKSTINSCAKEFDRDQRELKKKQLAASRAKQRKDELAARKAEKEAEKTRQRAERRIQKSQPFSKKEAVEFERALSNSGVVYKSDGKTVNWEWFHSKVDGFDAKYEDTLDAAYLELLSEAHRINDLAAAKEDEDYEAVDRINESKKPSAVFSTLTVERAEKLIERLEFFRALRGEVLKHPKITSILRGFKKTRDLPLWWKSSHDKSLLLGVDRHGLNGWEYMGADDTLSFGNSMKAWQRKNAGDAKSLKRAAMPKSSSGIKRAFALVRYFRSRANDPHFEFYSRENEAAQANGEGGSVISGVIKREVKPEPIPEKPLMQLRRRESAAKTKKKTDSPATPHGNSGRPRTLRQTLIKIPIDEHGILILPADLGDGLFLLNLGEVMQGVFGFCQNGIIFPVGYRTIRQMGTQAFLCEIVASQDRMYPEFRVSALEGFDEKAKDEDTMWNSQRVIGTSRNVVTLWMRVVNEEISRDNGGGTRVSLASGPERFGLYEPTIVCHIQKLPGAKYVEGFELRDFSLKGAGARIEPSVGIIDAMMKALDSRLEPREDRQSYNAVMTDDDVNPREGALIAEEIEMSIPEEWIGMYGGAKRKHRRRSSSYWG